MFIFVLTILVHKLVHSTLPDLNVSFFLSTTVHRVSSTLTSSLFMVFVICFFVRQTRLSLLSTSLVHFIVFLSNLIFRYFDVFICFDVFPCCLFITRTRFYCNPSPIFTRLHDSLKSRIISIRFGIYALQIRIHKRITCHLMNVYISCISITKIILVCTRRSNVVNIVCSFIFFIFLLLTYALSLSYLVILFLSLDLIFQKVVCLSQALTNVIQFGTLAWWRRRHFLLR